MSYITSTQNQIVTSYLPVSIITSTLLLPALVSTSVQTVFVTSSLPGTTLYRTVVAPPSTSTAYQTITLPASTITSTAVLPASTEFVTRTLSLVQTPAGPPALGATVSPTACWANADGQAPAAQTQTITTTSFVPGAVVTSTAFLPGLTLEQTVSLTLFRTVTAVITQRETLNFYVTSTLPQQTTTNTIFATTTLPQATVSLTSTQYIGPPIAEVRANNLPPLRVMKSSIDACFIFV